MLIASVNMCLHLYIFTARIPFDSYYIWRTELSVLAWEAENCGSLVWLFAITLAKRKSVFIR